MADEQQAKDNGEKVKKQDAAVAVARTRITPTIAKKTGLDPAVYGGKSK